MMPLGSPAMDPEKAGASNRNYLQLSNGSPNGQRYGFRNSTRHKNDEEFQDTLTEGSDDDDFDSRNIQSVKRKRNDPANRHVIDTEDEDEEEMAARQKKLKKRREERKGQLHSSHAMDSEENIKMEIDSMDEETEIRRGTRLRKPNQLFNDYDLGSRPRNQIKNRSVDSADETLAETNNCNHTENGVRKHRSRQAGPSPTSPNVPRKRGRPRKYPRPDDCDSVTSTNDESCSPEVPVKIDGRKLRKRNPDGTFMKKEVKDEIVTEDETAPNHQEDKSPRVSFQVSERRRTDGTNSAHESSGENPSVVTRSRTNARLLAGSNSPPLRAVVKERGYATDGELCRTPVKRGPGRPRKYPLPITQNGIPQSASAQPKNNAARTVNTPNLQAKTSRVVNTPRKQETATSSANLPRTPHRKNDVSAKECVQLLGPGYDLRKMMDELPNRILRSGKEINTEDEASDNDEEAGRKAITSTPEKDRKEAQPGKQVQDPLPSMTETCLSPQKETSKSQKMTENAHLEVIKELSSPVRSKPKDKKSESEEQQQQPRPLRSCSARSSKDKTESKANRKVDGDIRKFLADNRKDTARPNRECKPGSTSKGKATCANIPSTTGTPSSFKDLEGMPILDRLSPSKPQASSIIGSEDEADEVAFVSRGTRYRPTQDRTLDEEVGEPPVLHRETYLDGPTTDSADTSGDGPPRLAQELDPFDVENCEVGSPPTLSPQRLQPINQSPGKSSDQSKQQSPARKSSPRKEALLRFNKDNECNQARTSRTAPSSPSKCQKKAGEDKKESEAAFSSKARQRLPAVQIARTRTIAKFELPPPPVLLQLQTIGQLPDTPESQSTPELLEAQNAEAISSPRRSPRKNSTKSPVKEEVNVNEEEHNPKGSLRDMRPRETGETTPVDFASRKRRADDELIFAFNPLAKRYKSDSASSTTDEIPNSSSKSTASLCSNSSVSSSVTSHGRAHSRKAYTPKKVVNDVEEAAPREKENAIWCQFYNKKPEEYAKIFQTSVKMYKELADRGWRPFMRRNLLYIKPVLDETALSKHRIGENVPPLVYERKPVHVDPAISRQTRNKNLYLQKVIERMTQKEYCFKYVREKYGIDVSNGYSVGMLAKAEILEEKEAGKGRQYIYRELGESEVGSSIPETLIDSVVFTTLRHQILPGKRVGWTDIFLAYEVKGKLSKLYPLQHITFPLWINENNKTTVDLLDQEFDEYDKLYLVAKVEITSNLASCKVKGHTLRSRNDSENPSKATYFPKHGEYPIEHTYWGAALFHEPEGVGYRLGSVNIELINQDFLQIKNQKQKGFMQGLLSEIKKNNTNPFLVTEVKRRPRNELSSSENEYYTDSDISLKHGNSGEAPRCCGSHSQRREHNEIDSDEEDESRQGTAGISSRQLRKVISNVTLSALLGKVKPKKGRYINDKEMLKTLFVDPRILQDNKKMSMINKWMPLAFPEKIKYRFLCYVQPKNDEVEESSEHSSGRDVKEKKCTSIQFKKLDWFVTEQNDEPNRCIICGWQFSDMYSLMLHYNTTYPRLAFIFTIRDTMFEECRTASDARVVVDVMLEPRFQEIHELLPTAVTDPIRRISSSRFLVIKAVTNAMKATLRRDNTIFARLLNVPEIVDETHQYVSKYVNTDSGLPMSISDEVDCVTTRVPNPGFRALHEKLLRILQDFIDIDQTTKNFMSTWNKMVLAIGRYNQVILGPYMEHRLFIDVFWDVMNTDENWKKTFCAQLVEYGDCGTLSGDECHDLWQRLYNRDYNPLKDENSALYRELLDHWYKRNRTFRRGAKKHKVNTTKKAAPYYKKNPREQNEEAMENTVEYFYWNTKIVPKQDGRRLFMADPLDNIPNNTKEHLQEFFSTLEHIDLREGEIDMYRA